MRQITRRDVLGGTVGAVGMLAGCLEIESSGAFTQTSVEDQQLVVEFEESLEAETISVVDPAGEAFAETDVSAGVSRVTFEIQMPYTPGEYRIVAGDGGETVAETTQEIRPELEIIDVGVGANRMDEMPESLGNSKRDEAIVVVENSWTGPEMIQRMQILGDVPNPKQVDGDRTGIWDPDSGGRRNDPLRLNGKTQRTFFSSTLPFLFEGDGVDCTPSHQEGTMTVEIHGEISGITSVEFVVQYSAAESYNGCDISLKEVS